MDDLERVSAFAGALFFLICGDYMKKHWNWLYSLAIGMYLTAMFTNRWWLLIGSGLYTIAGSILVCFGKD